MGDGRCCKLAWTFSPLPAAALLILLPASVYAQDPTQTFAEPEAPVSKLALSANATFTTDYVFRGISQTAEGPAVQGGFELEYDMFYLGAWGSNVDFGSGYNSAGNLENAANIEIDWYGGLRPEWKGISFDLGVFYYTFPGGLETWNLDYVELGTAASYTFRDRLTLAVANWWTPENSGHTGYNDVVEGSALYAFDQFWIFTPSLSALIGRQWGEESEGGYDYTYWNAGLTLDFSKGADFSLDVRYWDTNIAGCDGLSTSQCDERIVGSVTTLF